MNVIKILLIVGLIYAAMTQKSEKTKNMLLVVTALLAFCMVSMEGLEVYGPETPERCTITPGNANQESTEPTVCPDPANGACANPTAGSGSCSYEPPGTSVSRAALPADLGELFSSCVPGSAVKSTLPETVAEHLCETGGGGSRGYEDFCGEVSECNGMPAMFGGVALTEGDNTNLCGETYLGYKSTCKCIDDTKTWTPDGCVAGDDATADDA
jgi:hypothetical protein